jgi:hypothetical protein
MDLRIINIRLNITEEGLRATLGNFNNYKADEVFWYGHLPNAHSTGVTIVGRYIGTFSRGGNVVRIHVEPEPSPKRDRNDSGRFIFAYFS